MGQTNGMLAGGKSLLSCEVGWKVINQCYTEDVGREYRVRERKERNEMKVASMLMMVMNKRRTEMDVRLLKISFRKLRKEIKNRA